MPPRGINMPPNPSTPIGIHAISERMIRRLMGSLSLFTLLMTIPQVLTIWISRTAAGVSVVSWSAYLLSAVFWLMYGIRKRDKNIYLPCLGWITLDSAVILGVLFYG